MIGKMECREDGFVRGARRTRKRRRLSKVRCRKLLLYQQRRDPTSDTLSALIVPSCEITIADHAEDSAVPIALPENMTTVTTLPVPALSQTVNEHIEIPHFRLLSATELAALGTRGRKSRDDYQVCLAPRA